MKEDEIQPEWAVRLEAKVDEVMDHLVIGTSRQTRALEDEWNARVTAFRQAHPEAKDVYAIFEKED